MTPSADSNVLEKFWNGFQTCEARRDSPHMLKAINRSRRLRLVPLVPAQKSKHISAEEPSEWNVCRMRQQFCSSLFSDSNKRSLQQTFLQRDLIQQTRRVHLLIHRPSHCVGCATFSWKGLLFDAFNILCKASVSRISLHNSPCKYTARRSFPPEARSPGTLQGGHKLQSCLLWRQKKQNKKSSVWLQNSPWRNYCYSNWDD